MGEKLLKSTNHSPKQLMGRNEHSSPLANEIQNYVLQYYCTIFDTKKIISTAYIPNFSSLWINDTLSIR